MKYVNYTFSLQKYTIFLAYKTWVPIYGKLGHLVLCVTSVMLEEMCNYKLTIIVKTIALLQQSL